MNGRKDSPAEGPSDVSPSANSSGSPRKPVAPTKPFKTSTGKKSADVKTPDTDDIPASSAKVVNSALVACLKPKSVIGFFVPRTANFVAGRLMLLNEVLTVMSTSSQSRFVAESRVMNVSSPVDSGKSSAVIVALIYRVSPPDPI